MPKKLESTQRVKALLIGKFSRHHRAWFRGEGEWPLRLSLGIPIERDVVADLGEVQAWVSDWSAWRGAGELQWAERSYPRLGSQRLPATLVLQGPGDVASWCNESPRWSRALARRQRLGGRWPQLAAAAGLARHFDVLADYSEPDFERLMAVLTWVLAHPQSRMYVRQLPIEGVDTKWIEKRGALVTDLLSILRGGEPAQDLYAACGLRRMPHRIRLRVLCPQLRCATGGLGDVQAPLEDLTSLGLRPKAVLIVENHECGAALPDIDGVAAFIGLGGSVGALGTIPWLADVPVLYWGDLDTHGFGILAQARRVLPQAVSVLMDEATIETHRALVVVEEAQRSDVRLDGLTQAERAIFDGLRAGRWGPSARLEQERLSWPQALDAIRSAIAFAVDGSSTRQAA